MSVHPLILLLSARYTQEEEQGLEQFSGVCDTDLEGLDLVVTSDLHLRLDPCSGPCGLVVSSALSINGRHPPLPGLLATGADESRALSAPFARALLPALPGQQRSVEDEPGRLAAVRGRHEHA